MAQNKPFLPDIATALSMGIGENNLPMKLLEKKSSSKLKEDTLRILRYQDLERHISKYTWYNIPLELTSAELERLLYYKGSLALAYLEEIDEIVILPYALCSDEDIGIDAYGRYKSIKLVPIAAEKKENKMLNDYLATKIFKVYYDIPLKDVDIAKSAVIIRDYDNGLSQAPNIPKSVLVETWLDSEAQILPYLFTCLQNSSGVSSVRVNSADEASNIQVMNNSFNWASLNQEKYVPVIGKLDFQELNGERGGTTSDTYLKALQSLDNYIVSTIHGLPAGAIYEKQSHLLESESQDNKDRGTCILQNGLMLRQRFCLIVNAIFGTSIWCELSENTLGVDKGDNGVLLDEQGGEYEGTSM